MKSGLNFYQIVIGFQLGVFGAIAIANAAIGQTVADDTGNVCWNQYGQPIECQKQKSAGFPSDSAPDSDRGSGRSGTSGSGASRMKDGCDRYGQPPTGRRRCTITSLPEAANQDPDLIGQPGTPDRTQGSGTR